MYACATLQNLCHDPGWSQIVVAHGLQPRIEELVAGAVVHAMLCEAVAKAPTRILLSAGGAAAVTSVVDGALSAVVARAPPMKKRCVHHIRLALRVRGDGEVRKDGTSGDVDELARSRRRLRH